MKTFWKHIKAEAIKREEKHKEEQRRREKHLPPAAKWVREEMERKRDMFRPKSERTVILLRKTQEEEAC